MKEPMKTLHKHNKENLNKESQIEDDVEDGIKDVIKSDGKVNAENLVEKKPLNVADIIKNTLQLLLGFLIIMLFLSIAKVIISYFESTFPASILGMLLLFLALSLGLIKLKWVEFTGNIILKYLALLFIPVGVGLINYFELIMLHWLVIVFSLFFTTLFTLFMVGHCYQWLAEEK